MTPAKPTSPPLPESEPVSADARLPGVATLLQDMYAQQMALKEECKVPKETRLANIKRRREQWDSDEAAKLGYSIGRKIAQAKTQDSEIELTEQEVSLLQLEKEFHHRRKPYDMKKLTPKIIAHEIHQLLKDLGEKGDMDVVTPYSLTPDSNEGARRIQGEASIVGCQVALIERAREETYRTNGFEYSVRMVRDIVGGGLREAPVWYVEDLAKLLEERVGTVNVTDDNLELFEQAARLEDGLWDIKPKSKDEIDRLREASLEDLRKDSYARIYKIALRAKEASETYKKLKEETKRQLIHERLVKSLTDDTYVAAIEAGRMDFTELSDGGFNQARQQFRYHNIEIPGRAVQISGEKEPIVLRYEVPITVLNDKELFREINDRLKIRDYSNPIDRLRVILYLKEDKALFGRVVDRLTQARVDQANYSVGDYPNPDIWRGNWEQALMRTLDGYAIGMLESAVEAEMDPNTHSGLQRETQQRIDRNRHDVAVNAFQILYGENNPIDRDVGFKRLDEYGREAFVRIGKYMEEKNTDADRKIYDRVLRLFIFPAGYTGESCIEEANRMARNRKKQASAS